MALCVASPWLIPLAFGEQWRPALRILPFLALATFIVDLFSLHAHIVTVRSRLRSLIQSYLATFVLRLALATLLLPLLGLEGYGVAVILALLALLPLHWGVRAIFPPRYDQALPWLVGFSPLLFVPIVPDRATYVLWLPLLGVVLAPATRRQLSGYIREARALVKNRSAAVLQPGHVAQLDQ